MYMLDSLNGIRKIVLNNRGANGASFLKNPFQSSGWCYVSDAEITHFSSEALFAAYTRSVPQLNFEMISHSSQALLMQLFI